MYMVRAPLYSKIAGRGWNKWPDNGIGKRRCCIEKLCLGLFAKLYFYIQFPVIIIDILQDFAN